MNLVDEIRNKFAKGNFGVAMPVAGLPSEHPAWTIKQTDSISVAVPIRENIVFSEVFSNVSINTKELVKIGNQTYDILILASSDMEARNEFASFCADFIDPGQDGSRREELISNPKIWWEKWKRLVGNTSVDIKPYDVLAELLVVEKLMEKDLNPKWTGKTFGTNDIETVTRNYEVKSTTSRYGNEVSISSLYQLSPKAGKELDLVFVRFEEADYGDSVEKAASRLKKLGYDSNELEIALKRHGLEPGRTGREKKYNLLEMRDYAVDENFPAVTKESFKNDQVPEAVVRFTYSIDLAGIEYENLM